MKVAIVCSDRLHPVYEILSSWINNQDFADAHLYCKLDELPDQGDFLFLVSCSELVKKNVRDKFKHTLVLHASDLPHGKGWSPHVWGIINGENAITLSLLEAEDAVDSGRIWKKEVIQLNGTELYDEVNDLLFRAEIRLIEWAIRNEASVKPMPQTGEGSYYRKRTPSDSEVKVDSTLEEIFNLLRVSDPNRFPVFFNHKGRRFELIVRGVDANE